MDEKQQEQDAEEIARKRDEALRRALSTPPKPRDPVADETPK